MQNVADGSSGQTTDDLSPVGTLVLILINTRIKQIMFRSIVVSCFLH